MDSTKLKVKVVGQYKILMNILLGKGTTGHVYLAQSLTQSKVFYAIKEINISKLDEYKSKCIEFEINNLQKFQSPYVVRLIDFISTENNIYLILEYCEDGDLKSYIQKKNGTITEIQAITLFRHIVQGFKQLYKNNVIHRDIKPANILLKQGIAKITDFGFSRVVDKLQQCGDFSSVGTPNYSSPQVLRRQKFSSKCDVWSVGIVFYKLLYGKIPWTGQDIKSLSQNIKNNELELNFPFRREIVKNLLKKMLAAQQSERMSWPQIFQHPLCKDQIITMKQIKSNHLKSIETFSQYLNENFVRGYLKNYFNLHQQSNRNLTVMQPEEIEQHRKTMVIIFSKIMFQRNLAFFFCYLLKLIFKYTANVPKEFNQYLELEYILEKSSVNFIENILKNYFEIDFPLEFQKSQWIQFKNTSQFTTLRSLIYQDYRIIKQILNFTISKIIKIIEINSVKKKESRHIKRLDSLLNGNNWKDLYITIINENIEVLKKALKKEKNEIWIGSLIKNYLEISLFPNNYFTNEKFDFHCFYENNQIKFNLFN